MHVSPKINNLLPISSVVSSSFLLMSFLLVFCLHCRRVVERMEYHPMYNPSYSFETYLESPNSNSSEWHLFDNFYKSVLVSIAQGSDTNTKFFSPSCSTDII